MDPAVRFQDLLAMPEDSDQVESNSISESEVDESGKVEEVFRGGIHRSAAALLLQGKTPDQIAGILKLDVDKVKSLLRQKHTQEVINELASEMGQSNSVEAVLQATELDTVFRLLELRDSASSHNVQLSACKELLTRRRGNVPIRKANEEEEEAGFGGDVSSQMQSLNSQIAELSKQLNKDKNGLDS